MAASRCNWTGNHVPAPNTNVTLIDAFLFFVDRIRQKPVERLNDLGIVRNVPLGLRNDFLEVLALRNLSLGAAEVGD